MQRRRPRTHLVLKPEPEDFTDPRIGVGLTPVGKSVVVWAQGGVLALWLATDDPRSALEFVYTRHGMEAEARSAHRARLDEESKFKRDDVGACRLLARIFEEVSLPHRRDAQQDADRPDWLGSDSSCAIPVLVRGSPFELLVWQGLCEIPRATVTTYSDLAARVGRPGAARAVGSAMARNGVAVLIACHRVIPSSGGVGQFRWGDQVKRKLIDWECGS